MNSIFDMNGSERAAALLVALGPEIAADIFRHLDEDSIDRITADIARIDQLTPADREELVGEFLISLRRDRKKLKGGESAARKLLEDSFGSDRADEVLKKVAGMDLEKDFEFAGDIEPDVLFTFLKDELPQTIAVTLAHLPSPKSAKILTMLPPSVSKQVALRMARMEKISPDAVIEISRTLRMKYRDYLKHNQGLTSGGGVDSLIDILQHMPGADEKKIMNQLERSMPDITSRIREKIFSFENILNMTNMEMRILIDEINDDTTIAAALKGAGDDIRFKFLRNMSRNRATDIINEMDAMGPVRLAEVEDYRARIITVMRMLNDNGVITMRKGKDILVE